MLKHFFSLFTAQSISTQSNLVSTLHRQNLSPHISILLLSLLALTNGAIAATVVPGYTPGELSSVHPETLTH